MTLPIDTIIEGDCVEVMRAWPDACAVTADKGGCSDGE